MKSVHREGPGSGSKEDHTTAGGQIIEEILPHSFVSEMIQIAIYSHHGLRDCIDLEDSAYLLFRRKEKAAGLPVEEARDSFLQGVDKDELARRCEWAQEETRQIVKKIKDTVSGWDKPDRYGNRDFFLGMYQRLLLSLLIDADRRDTEDFMKDPAKAGCTVEVEEYSEEKLQEIWRLCEEHVERRIAKFTDKSGINGYRSEISDRCVEQAKSPYKLYRLTVPTGAGKTLSSLRFAVRHALKYHKRRIIYVAPYQSILDQNAREIEDTLDVPGIVLEHHCNIVLENDEEQAYYDRVTEDWALPVIVTTAVQFLNTLFAGKTGNVRRMHRLCDSVIIMDEVQSLPVKLTQLFNMAVNFLTVFADTTMVLCTATQPLLEQIPENRLFSPRDMVDHVEQYQEAFRRTEIVDCTQMVAGGMEIQEAARFALEKVGEFRQVLFVVNTRCCAKELFKELERLCKEPEFDKDQESASPELYHLSTGMCPEHRSQVMKRLAGRLGVQETVRVPLICVSTQLIEAGVDLSFGCVIRSLAGLDSLIQAAGRCNRHKDWDLGMVYLIKMSANAENLSRLTYIRKAGESMEEVLGQFNRDPEFFGGRLDSQQAIQKYYECNYRKWLGEMKYGETVMGVSTSLVNLLSDNPEFKPGNRMSKTGRILKDPQLKQAFKTAGDIFEAIEENGKIAAVIPYDKSARDALFDLEGDAVPAQQKKLILRKLQRFTVSLSQAERQALKDVLTPVWEGRVLVLDERFYDKNLGVVMEPGPMPELIM